MSVRKRAMGAFLALWLLTLGVTQRVAARDIADAVPAEETTVLYDGALGTVPSQQGFTFLAFPPGPAPAVDGVGSILDTTASTGFYAGYFGRIGQVPTLDAAAGYAVVFTAQLQAETHVSPNRAGFSVIVLSDDADGAQPVRGIEVAFWSDQIWVQDDDQMGGALFTHAEGAAYDATAVTTYRLSVSGDSYKLAANGTTIVSGRLRDYGNFAGFPDPYETPNLLFLGDDTSSASARLRLEYVAVVVPGDESSGDHFQYLPLTQRP